jgi:hypothetical protein
MPRFFNNAGPIVPADHYSIDPLSRLDWEDIQHLIQNKRYFVLHAPRQTGKTSTLLAMMEVLNRASDYIVLYANIETAQAARGDLSLGIPGICQAIARSAQVYLQDVSLAEWLKQNTSNHSVTELITQMLQYWASHSDKPIVLMLDEVDALVGDTLISLLRQIRAGYGQRPTAFPQSIILCGVRDVRDYRIHTSNHEIITGGSAFNIKTESLRLGNFSFEEVKALYQQHTDETGQPFEPAIFSELWEDTCGQPWLVNALGYELTWKDRAARDRGKTITLADYRAARERLIQSRATHLDQLADKLREPRVNQVVAALLGGEETEQRFPEDDLKYIEDLGLIRTRPQLTIANRIYREVIPREITWPIQTVITHDQAWYLTSERKLDMAKLLSAFQQFFREHSAAWLQQWEYQEAGPHLLLQAFLQRIVNGGGRVNREYGLGRKRTDLLVEWPIDPAQGYLGPVQRIVIELKLLRKGLEKTLAEGLVQTADYADRVNADEAHLVIFNRDTATPWDDKIWHQRESHQNHCIDVWGA